MKRYSISVGDLDPEIFVAETAAKARYRAYRQFKEAFASSWSFAKFLDNIKLCHLGPEFRGPA